MVVAAGLAVLLVAGVAGGFGYAHLRDRPAHQAFEAAQRAFTPLVERLAWAEDVQQLNSLGTKAQSSKPGLETQQRTLSGQDSELGTAALDVVAGQVAMAEALGELADLDEDALSGWGDIERGLREASAALNSATTRLRAVRADWAARVAATAPAVAHVERLVGGLVAESATRSLGGLLDRLSSVGTTRQIRGVAAQASREMAATDAALPGLDPNTAEAQSLAAVGAVLAQVARLSSVDGDHLSAWQPIRAPLQSALGALSGSGDLAAAEAGDRAVAHLNKVIAGAMERIGDWDAKYEAAVEQRSADLAAMKEYAGQLQAQLQIYDTLRGDASEFFERVEDPGVGVTWGEAFDFLQQAGWDRESVRDSMNYLAVPQEVQADHSTLVGVVDRAIVAVQAGYDGLGDAYNCETACYYRNTPAWKRFSAESARITGLFGEAEGSWGGAVTTAESAVANRHLPKKPRV